MAPGAIAHRVLPQLADRSPSHRGVRRQHLAALLSMSRQGLWKAARRMVLRLPVPDDGGHGPSRRRSMAEAANDSP
jgi:hypothetical protein